jgi:hypothetical protein
MLFLSLLLTAALWAGDFPLQKNELSPNWKTTKFSHRFEEGTFSATIPADCVGGSILLMQKLTLQAGSYYNLSYTLEAEHQGIIAHRYMQTKSPRANLGLNHQEQASIGVQKHAMIFRARKNSTAIPAYLFIDLSRLQGRVNLSDIKLERLTSLEYGLSSTWTVFRDIKGATEFAAIPKVLEGVDGGRVEGMEMELKNGQIHLGKYKPNQSLASLYTVINAPKDGFMKIGLSADWYFDVYVNGATVAGGLTGSPAFSPDDNIVLLPLKKGANLLTVIVRSGQGGWRFICGKPHSDKTHVFEEGKDWKPANVVPGGIVSGSALDLSSPIDAPAGRYGRLTISKTGSAVFEKKQDEPVRLLGFNVFPRNFFYNRSDSEFKRLATEYARAARRQGYRIYRENPALDMLCKDSGKDMEINPRLLDRWDYLMNELKREGIYSHLVIFNEQLYRDVYRRKPRDRDLHKLMLYLEGEWQRDRFSYAVKTLFNHVNPYTGLAWKDDPAIAVVEFYNEQENGMYRLEKNFQMQPESKSILETFWRRWLCNRYPEEAPEAVKKELRGKTLADARLPSIKDKALKSDWALFWADRATATNKWCEKQVRDAGYPGLVTCGYTANLIHCAARWTTSQITDNHKYFCHPSKWFRPGSKVKQYSSIERATDYWRGGNSAKLAGRPFMVGEYNHVFWNPYRYESGMVFSAYSALQGYCAILVHMRPVHVDMKTYYGTPFTCAPSLVSRASQFLSACLFQRGDIKASKNLVCLEVPKPFFETNGNIRRAISSEQSKLGLISGFGLSFPWLQAAKGTAPVNADMTIYPTGSSEVKTHGWFSEIMESSSEAAFLDQAVVQMKKRGILPERNISKPSAGVFQSDTGEIELHSSEKLMKVITPRTEGVCLTAGKSERLALMTVNKVSTNACVALCSVDGGNLKNSTRMVMIFSTQEANSGMELSSDGHVLNYPGTAPLLLKTGQLSLLLTTSKAPTLKLYALNLDGSRAEQLLMRVDGERLHIDIDTATLKKGPTTFFELVSESL